MVEASLIFGPLQLFPSFAFPGVAMALIHSNDGGDIGETVIGILLLDTSFVLEFRN